MPHANTFSKRKKKKKKKTPLKKTDDRNKTHNAKKVHKKKHTHTFPKKENKNRGLSTAANRSISKRHIYEIATELKQIEHGFPPPTHRKEHDSFLLSIPFIMFVFLVHLPAYYSRNSDPG